MSREVQRSICGDYSPLDRQIGFQIHLKRVVAHLSEEQLASILQVDSHAISDYEQGKKPISASTLHHISVVLRVPITEFFDSFSEAFDLDASSEPMTNCVTANPYEEQKNKSFQVERSVVQLLEAFRSLKEPAVRQRMVELMKMLADDENARTVSKI